MASITASNNNSILRINAFLGLNENPDGDTTLQPGEFSEMRNFRITQDRHLQIRPGTKTVLEPTPEPASDELPHPVPDYDETMTGGDADGSYLAYGI